MRSDDRLLAEVFEDALAEGNVETVLDIFILMTRRSRERTVEAANATRH